MPNAIPARGHCSSKKIPTPVRANDAISDNISGCWDIDGASMFRFFEKLVSPYPQGAAQPLPQAFFPFLWACAAGARRYIASMTLLTAAIGVFEALLFSMLGRVVDWLAKVQPSRLWAEQRLHLAILAAVLFGSVVVVALQSLLKQQALAGNFAMRLRWNFHRNMLAQSLSFYQDEFAGRVATKVM